MLKDGKHHFIFSCKGNYPFKHRTLPFITKRKGSSAWTSSKKKLLVVSWRDKKPPNILTNYYKRPAAAGWKNGVPIPNYMASYRSTLGFVDQANAYRLRYRFLHRTMKHTRVQFLSILFLAVVNAWILYKHVNQKNDVTYRQYFRALMDALTSGTWRKRKPCTPKPFSTPLSPTTPPSATPSPIHMPLAVQRKGTCAECENGGNQWNCSFICTGCSTDINHLIYLHQHCFAKHHNIHTSPFAAIARTTKK